MNQAEQIQLAQKLQAMLLTHFEGRLADGSIPAAEVATLARILLASGWVLDKDALPQDIRDKIKGASLPPSTEEMVEECLGSL